MARLSKKPLKRLDLTLKSDAEDELVSTLRHRLVGQETAIAALVDAYVIFKSGLSDPEHSIANLMFLGPTGVGKTLSLEIMAEVLFGTKQALKKVNCAEFQHSHEIAKLIGSPPGYLGHRDTPAYLRQENLDQNHTADNALTLLLFDEFEKANDALWTLLLGILDKGTVTLGDSKTTTFKNCIIAMTGNLGAREMQFLLRGGMGFQGSATRTQEEIDKGTDKAGIDAMNKKFPPEFINRIDDIVVFHALDPRQLGQVIDIELEQVQSRILKMQDKRQFVLDFTPAAKEFLLDKGTDIKNGARPLKRTIERHIVKRLARFLSTGQIELGDLVMVDRNDDGLKFACMAKGVLANIAEEEEALAAEAAAGIRP